RMPANASSSRVRSSLMCSTIVITPSGFRFFLRTRGRRVAWDTAYLALLAGVRLLRVGLRVLRILRVTLRRVLLLRLRLRGLLAVRLLELLRLGLRRLLNRLLLRGLLALVVMLHLLDLGLEDAHRAAQGAGGVGKLLRAEEKDEDDQDENEFPATRQAHRVVTFQSVVPAGCTGEIGRAHV